MKFEDSLVHKIKYLCREIPREEWSGVLFYTVEGSITSPENMFVTLKDVYPMQKGVAAYTEYDFNEELIDYRMENPATNFMQVGHMHSHNTMQTFFSGTDTSELNDNSEFHNYYLSVIVNNYFDVCARVAFRGKKASSVFIAKTEDGTDYKVTIPATEEVMFYYNCDIIRDTPEFMVEESFIQRTSHIIAEAAKRPKTITSFPASHTPVTGYAGTPVSPAAAFQNNIDKGKVVEIPGTNRRYLSDYLPANIPKSAVIPVNNVAKPAENTSNNFQFIADEFLSEHNVGLGDYVDETDIADEQAEMLEDLMIDVMLSYPRVQNEYAAFGDTLTLLDDVFAYIRSRVGKNTRAEYLKYVIDQIPIQYNDRFTYSNEDFDNDYLVMVQMVANLKDDYKNAEELYPLMVSFLQKFRHAREQQVNPV